MQPVWFAFVLVLVLSEAVLVLVIGPSPRGRRSDRDFDTDFDFHHEHEWRPSGAVSPLGRAPRPVSSALPRLCGRHFSPVLGSSLLVLCCGFRCGMQRIWSCS
jgi:hypothetical protein